jgi:YVTN family beta-propeller protein
MRACFILAIIIWTVFAKAQKKPDYKIVATYHIASTGGWDYLVAHRGKLYVSHGTQVNILDQATGDSSGVIFNTPGVHGIAFDDAGIGFTSNGRSNNVTVFEVKSDSVTAQIPTGENPDAILYDPYTKTLVTCNGRSKNLSIIDPEKNITIATIDVGGKPETAVSDGKGLLFVNIEDKNEIVEIDLKNRKLLQHWSLGSGEGPTGLAYDKATQRLFAGCEKQLIVMNAKDGKVVATLPIGAGCDGVAFDPKAKIIFTSNGADGNMTAVKEESADRFSVLGNYPTKRGGRTISIDPQSGTLFIPTADFESTPTTTGRPRAVPGTFQVLVIRNTN